MMANKLDSSSRRHVKLWNGAFSRPLSWVTRLHRALVRLSSRLWNSCCTYHFEPVFARDIIGSDLPSIHLPIWTTPQPQTGHTRVEGVGVAVH